MKITNSTPNYINQTYANQANTAGHLNLKNPQQTPDEAPTDSINLSERTKDLQRIEKALESNAPEREKYVARIKQRVENNQYNVNAEAVAEKMLGGMIDGMG